MHRYGCKEADLTEVTRMRSFDGGPGGGSKSQSIRTGAAKAGDLSVRFNLGDLFCFVQ